MKHTLPQPALSSATSGASDSELAGVAGPSLATSKASADAAIAADLLQLGQRDPRESDAASRVAGPGNAPAASTAAHANKPAAVEKPPATIRATPAELPRVFDRLAVRVHDADRKAVVELDPPELGRLSIALSLEGGGRVRAEMRAEQPSGYAALQSQISQLHASLIERGFTSASVDLQLGLANQDSQQSGARRGGSRARAGAQETLSDADVRAIARAHDSAIDMWA